MGERAASIPRSVASTGEMQQGRRGGAGHAAELVVRWAPDGTRQFVNDAHCRLFDASREELIDTSFWPLVTEADRDRVRERLASLSPATPVTTGRHRASASSGVVWMEWVDRAIFDSTDRSA